MANLDLQIRGRGERPGHPDPEIRGGGGVAGLKKILFRSFGPQFRLKIREAPPLDPLLLFSGFWYRKGKDFTRLTKCIKIHIKW